MSHPTVEARPPICHPNSTNRHNMDTYREMYARSIDNPSEFWAEVAKSNISWFRPFDETMGGSFTDGDIRWFTGGKLNVSYNCIDRHLASRAEQVSQRLLQATVNITNINSRLLFFGKVTNLVKDVLLLSASSLNKCVALRTSCCLWASRKAMLSRYTCQ